MGTEVMTKATEVVEKFCRFARSIIHPWMKIPGPTKFVMFIDSVALLALEAAMQIENDGINDHVCGLDGDQPSPNIPPSLSPSLDEAGFGIRGG